MQISDAQQKAAGELVDLVATRVGSGRAVHPETAIASAARLSGSLLLRSFNLKIAGAKPGEVVLSHEANEEGPELLHITTGFLQLFGVSLEKEKLDGDSMARGKEPTLSVVQSLALLQEDALRIARENGLDLKDAARAGAMATAFIVKECAQNIGAEVGFNVAAFGFIEGCKTIPPDIEPTPKAESERKPWYKLW
jgi:hypothetical protein